jgi:hypothetical protein
MTKTKAMKNSFFFQTDKRSKDDEALFLRNTLKETQDNLNQEKRFNSSIKLGRVSLFPIKEKRLFLFFRILIKLNPMN